VGLVKLEQSLNDRFLHERSSQCTQPDALRDSKSERWTNPRTSLIAIAFSRVEQLQHRQQPQSSAQAKLLGSKPTAPKSSRLSQTASGGVRCYDCHSSYPLGCDCCLSRTPPSPGPKLNRGRIPVVSRLVTPGYPLSSAWPYTTCSEAGGIPHTGGKFGLRRMIRSEMIASGWREPDSAGNVVSETPH